MTRCSNNQRSRLSQTSLHSAQNTKRRKGWPRITCQSPFLFTTLLGLATTLTALSTFTFPAQARFTENSQLTIDINGLRNQEGQLCLSLFASSEGFPNDGTNAVQNKCVSATFTTSNITFSDIKPGSYAIAVLHDANSDSEINRNFLGIPSEGFGFSGNPIIRTGPPAFSDAIVFVAGSETNIQIQLNYF